MEKVKKQCLTITEAYHILRDAGYKTNPAELADRMENGEFPWAHIKRISTATGRRTFEIHRADLMRWIAERSAGTVQQSQDAELGHALRTLANLFMSAADLIDQKRTA